MHQEKQWTDIAYREKDRTDIASRELKKKGQILRIGKREWRYGVPLKCEGRYRMLCGQTSRTNKCKNLHFVAYLHVRIKYHCLVLSHPSAFQNVTNYTALRIFTGMKTESAIFVITVSLPPVSTFIRLHTCS